MAVLNQNITVDYEDVVEVLNGERFENGDPKQLGSEAQLDYSGAIYQQLVTLLSLTDAVCGDVNYLPIRF